MEGGLVIAPLFLFGFLLGVRHALDADHVAAVAALATRSSSLRDNVRLAGLWGLGHAGTICVVGSVVIGLGIALPEGLSSLLELAVGAMLIFLGAGVLRRLRRDRVHVHAHRHGGTLHLHVHAHSGETSHDRERHDHEHPRGLRSFVVGGVHGLAGSAALVLLALESARSFAEALVVLAVFGLGSILGMILFSMAITLPLRLSARRLGAASRWVEGAVGTATLALGVWIVRAHFAF